MKQFKRNIYRQNESVITIGCNADANSGGVGVTDFVFALPEPGGGVIVMQFDAQSVPDKMEIIHNGVKKATSGMTVANGGPFDNLYGDPTIPTDAEATATDQFIGASKGTIPTRESTFISETGVTSITVTKQQLIWWEYSPADYSVSSSVTVRIVGISGTAWTTKRECPVDYVYTPPATTESISLGYSISSNVDACANQTLSPITQYMPLGEGFLATPTLYQDAAGTTLSITGYYSDGAKWRYWNGSAFTSSGFC